MSTTTNTDVAVIDNSIEILQGGAAILENNRASFSRAMQAGQALLAALAQGITTPEQDAQAKTFIDKIATTIDTLNNNRAEFTKALDIIKTAFTGLESGLSVKTKNSIAFQLQEMRNAYATLLHQQEQERLRKLKEQQEKDTEAISLKNEAEKRFMTGFNNLLASKKQALQSSFNSITLDNFNSKKTGLEAYTAIYSYDVFSAFSHGLENSARRHTPEEVNTLIHYHLEVKYLALAETYQKELMEFKQTLIDLLPSKKEELIKVAEFESEEEKSRQEEARRKEELAKADATRKSALEEEQRIADQQRREREEEQRLANVARETREREEKEKLEAEERQRQENTATQLETKKLEEQTATLFTATAEIAAVPVEAPKTKVSVKATITQPAGIIAIFQKWYQLDGKGMSVAELEKKLSFCFTAVNKDVNKTGDMIDSPYVNYVEEVKAK